MAVLQLYGYTTTKLRLRYYMRLGSYLERFTENYVGVKVFDLQTNVLLLYGTMQDKRFADSIKPYYTYMVMKQSVWDNWLLVYVAKPLGS